MVRPDPSRDGISWADVDIVSPVSDTPEEPEEGRTGPRRGRGHRTRTSRNRPNAGGSTPTTACGATRARSPDHPPTLRSCSTCRPGARIAALSWCWWGSWRSWPSSPGWSCCSPLRRSIRSTAEHGRHLADGSVSTLAGTQNTVPAAAQAAGRSMVELQATTAHGTVPLIGVAVAEGGVVATTADVLRGVRQRRDDRTRAASRAGVGGGHGHVIGHRAGERARGPPGCALRGRRPARQRDA